MGAIHRKQTDNISSIKYYNHVWEYVNAPDICGENKYGVHWNCADGSKGSYNFNLAYIQIEICEDALTDKQYFEEAFSLAAQLCARLMKNYPTIKLENIISHKEAHARGCASNHGDCDHWLAKFGRNMDWFRALVKSGSVIEIKYKVTGTKTVSKDKLPEAQGQFKALGFEITIEKV